MEDALLMSTQHETLRKEAQILESRSPKICSVSLGRPVAVNKGKLDCPGLLDRTVGTICSADTRDRCAITVHSSFVATWELGTHANYKFRSRYRETAFAF